MKINLAPSILGYSNQLLEEKILFLKQNNINIIHFDVMDGFFVKSTALTEDDIKICIKHNMKINLHLMVQNPQTYWDIYKKYKLNSISYQVEALSLEDNLNFLSQLKMNKARFGIAIKPETTINSIEKIMKSINFITVMGVEPGKGGQPYIEYTTEKLKDLRKIIDRNNLSIQIELDGGVNLLTIKKTINLVDYYVVGSFLFKAEDPKLALASLNDEIA